MKIHPVGHELFHVDGQTGVTKLITALQNFASTPKNIYFLKHIGSIRINYQLDAIEYLFT